MDYTRCKECSFVYDSSLPQCPHCGAETQISEELNNEPVFNIND